MGVGPGASYSVIYGAEEREAGKVTVRDMTTGEQARVPLGDVARHLGEAGPAGETPSP